MTPAVIPRHSIVIRWFAIAAAALLMLAACGSDSDDASTEPPQESTTTAANSSGDATTTTGAEAATTTAAASGGDGGSSGEYATVVLGGQTYEADFSGSFSQCIAMGGATGAVAPIADLEDATMDMTIPPEGWETSGDWDPPSIRLDLGEDANGVPIDWRAGGEVVTTYPQLEGMSQVDSVTYDGTTVSGTATFIDFFQVQLFTTGQVDQPPPVTGTFEVSCG